MPGKDGDGYTFGNVGVRPTQLDPLHVKHLPAFHGFDSFGEGFAPPPEQNSIVVNVVVARRDGARSPDLRVGERLVFLLLDKPANE
jgi:hypothetical protein